MKKLCSALLVLLLVLPALARAGVSAGDLPSGTIWYLHADLTALRESDAGSRLYAIFEEKVVVEINDEFEIDLNEELDSITAFTDSNLGTVVVVDGPLSQDTKDKLLKMAAAEDELETREYGGKRYFHIGDEEPYGKSERKSTQRESAKGDAADNQPFDDLEDSAYFSFDLKDRAIITGNEGQMQALLERGGKIAGSGNHEGSLFVLSADKSFVQAGLRTEGFSDDDAEDGWESNILRNTEQAALLVSEASGLIVIEAQLVSTDAKMAHSIGAIINGLIGLQAFNSELGPEIQDLIRNTKVDVKERTLSISSVVDPEIISLLMDE